MSHAALFLPLFAKLVPLIALAALLYFVSRPHRMFRVPHAKPIFTNMRPGK